jgi:hypothetical protein
MFEFIGKLKDISFDLKGNNAYITICVEQKNSACNCYEKLHEEKALDIKISKHKEKRSLNANAYAWKLISEISDCIRDSKDDVYVRMLKRYGQSELISVKSHIPVEEYVKYCEEAGESTLNGVLFKHYKVYKGSSEFDTREMSVFIDGIVDEAKFLGIEVKTPNELAKMKSMWGE